MLTLTAAPSCTRPTQAASLSLWIIRLMSLTRLSDVWKLSCVLFILSARMQFRALRNEIMLAGFLPKMEMRAMKPPGLSPRILKAIVPCMADLSHVCPH